MAAALVASFNGRAFDAQSGKWLAVTQHEREALQQSEVSDRPIPASDSSEMAPN
jgi:hypothetical protein